MTDDDRQNRSNGSILEKSRNRNSWGKEKQIDCWGLFLEGLNNLVWLQVFYITDARLATAHSF
jgi:hypothetical protein